MADQRPTPQRPKDEAIMWLDYATGRGLDPQGRPISPIIGGRRKHPNLHDLIETARFGRADRLILCGEFPKGHDWLLPTASQIARNIDLTPGWTDTGHYLGDPPRGRFLHAETRHRLAVSTTAEWFGETRLTPAQARYSYDLLTHVVAAAMDRPDWALMRSPAATGLNLWKQRFDKVRDFVMEPIDPAIGELIQATEPQHRSEHFVEGPGRCDCGACLPLMSPGPMPGFAYADGRFMYHGVTRGLVGSAPAWMLTGPQAEALFTSGERTKSGLHQGAFEPARYKVRYTVPDWWDHLGIFPMKQTEFARGWHWPNRPGFVGEAWVNAVELRTAILEGGWQVEFLEGIRFTRSNAIEPFANAIGKMLKDLDKQLGTHEVPAPAHAIVTASIKHLFRVTVGSFSRRQRNTTRFAATFEDVAANAVGEVRAAANGGFIYQVPTNSRPDDVETYHPEIAALLWGAARARVLRYAPPGQTKVYGALQVDPGKLIGIQGDAIYTTEPERWTLPTAHGGIDDGENGRIRLKGYLPGPIDAPLTIHERHDLSHQAEEAGTGDVYS